MDTPRNSNKSSPTEQDLLETLRQYCEINAKGDLSTESLLRYIKEEIEVRFVEPRYMVDRLANSLRRESLSGWIAFDNVYTIFVSWLNKQSSEIQFKIIKPTNFFKIFANTPSPSIPVASSTPFTSRKEKKFNGSEECSLKDETFYTACDGCGRDGGRDGSCCELRSEVENGCGKEQLKEYYEQKLTTLRELLTQSEDINLNMQHELDHLRETCNINKNKERHWKEEERVLKQREEHLTIRNNELHTRKIAAEAENQRLRQQISRAKFEHETLLSQYTAQEGTMRKWKSVEKELATTKKKISETVLLLQEKELLLEEKEEKIQRMTRDIEDYKEIVDSLEKRRIPKVIECDVFHIPNKLEEQKEHISGEPLVTENELNILSSNKGTLETLSLKAEIEAVMSKTHPVLDNGSIRPSFFVSNINVSTQTSFTESINVSTPTKCISTYGNASTQTINMIILKHATTQTTHLIGCDDIFTQSRHSNDEDSFIKVNYSKRSIDHEEMEIRHSQNGSNISLGSHSISFKSTHEMELLLMMDASIQTDYVGTTRVEVRECATQTIGLPTTILKIPVKALPPTSQSDYVAQTQFCSEEVPSTKLVLSPEEEHTTEYPPVTVTEPVTETKEQEATVSKISREKEREIILRPPVLTFLFKNTGISEYVHSKNEDKKISKSREDLSSQQDTPRPKSMFHKQKRKTCKKTFLRRVAQSTPMLSTENVAFGSGVVNHDETVLKHVSPVQNMMNMENTQTSFFSGIADNFENSGVSASTKEIWEEPNRNISHGTDFELHSIIIAPEDAELVPPLQEVNILKDETSIACSETKRRETFQKSTLREFMGENSTRQHTAYANQDTFFKSQNISHLRSTGHYDSTAAEASCLYDEESPGVSFMTTEMYYSSSRVLMQRHSHTESTTEASKCEKQTCRAEVTKIEITRTSKLQIMRRLQELVILLLILCCIWSFILCFMSPGDGRHYCTMPFSSRRMREIFSPRIKFEFPYGPPPT